MPDNKTIRVDYDEVSKVVSNLGDYTTTLRSDMKTKIGDVTEEFKRVASTQSVEGNVPPIYEDLLSAIGDAMKRLDEFTNNICDALQGKAAILSETTKKAADIEDKASKDINNVDTEINI